MQGSTVGSGPAFPNYLDEQISLQTGVIFDSVPFFRSFGDVTTDARSSYGVVS
jgi:neutral ceramidase